MGNLLSAIYDFLSVALVGGAILLFAGEIKLEATKKAAKGSTKLTSFTNSMTGTALDLSDKRVYGLSTPAN